MTSYIQTTLTGAALVAAMTLGGLTSAYAQFSQPYNEPYPEEPAIENAVTDEDEGLDGLQQGKWVYNGEDMSCGHEWVGVAGGMVVFQGLYQNIWDIYHKGGEIKTENYDTHIDRLWVTLDTLNATRKNAPNRFIVNTRIDKFILQVGETNVHGETFGIQTANQKLVMTSNNGIPTLSYGGKPCNGWGVDKNTNMEIDNHSYGVIDDVEIGTGTLNNQNFALIKMLHQKGGTCINNAGNFDYSGGYIYEMEQTGGHCCNFGKIAEYTMTGGTLDNWAEGLVGQMEQTGGNCCNWGKIAEYTMTGGTLDNTNGYIETLYYGGGTIEVQGNIDKIICIDGAAAGADSDGQDAAPLGEEAMVW